MNGEALVIRRRAMGLTQRTLAAKLNVSRGTVARWERGEQINKTNLEQLTKILAPHGKEILRIIAEPGIIDVILSMEKSGLLRIIDDAEEMPRA